MTSLIKDIKPIGWQFESCFINISVPIVSYSFAHADKFKNELVDIVDDIESFYLRNKPESFAEQDGETNTQSLNTHNFRNYNIFDFNEYESINCLQQFVSECIIHYKEQIFNFKSQPTYIQCWSNKVERLDYLSYHYHNNLSNISSLSANYFLKCSGIETFTEYKAPSNVFDDCKIIYIDNVEGDLTIFPSFIKHKTSPVRDRFGVRYSLGMDILENQYEDIKRTGCWKQII